MLWQDTKKQVQTIYLGKNFDWKKSVNTADPLEKLNAVINWDIFLPVLQELENKERKSNAGKIKNHQAAARKPAI